MNGTATKEEKEQAKILFPDGRICSYPRINRRHDTTNTLDLLFTNNLEMINNISVTPSQQTDHNLIEISTIMSLVGIKYYDQKSEKT